MQGEVANGVNGGVERSETAHVATTRRGGRGHKGRRADEAIGADQATGATKAVGQTRP